MEIPVKEWIETSKWQDFSGFIYGMSYSKQTRCLFVAFRHHNKSNLINSLYRYDGVPEEAASRLFCAEDKGRVFHDVIRKKYNYTLVAKYEQETGEFLDKVLRDSIYSTRRKN